MHTSAQPAVMAEYSGTLLHPAEVRTKLLDGEGHAVPVVCLDVELDTILRTPFRLVQYFPAGQHIQAQAAAHRYHKGQHISFSVPLVSVSINGIATHIHIDKEVTPCQP